MGAPFVAPSEKGTLSAFAPLGVTLVIVGAAGVSAATKALVADEARLVPSSFDEVPEHEYVVPIVRPLTVTGEDTPVAVCVAPPSDEVQVIVPPVVWLFGDE